MSYWTVLLLCVVAIKLQRCVSIPEHWAQYLGATRENKEIIVHFSRLGLANRLRTIADWYAIAEKSQRSLVVLWEVTRDCRSKFSDLFVNGPAGLKVLDSDGIAVNIEDIAQHINMAGVRYTMLDTTDMWAAGMSGFVLGRHVLESEAQVLLTDYDGILTAEGVNCQTYLSEHGLFLQQLQPNPEALAFSEDIYNTYFADSVMVGVHYRAHDPTQDWAVVPPLLGDATDKVFGQGATVQDFVTQMHQVDGQVSLDSKQYRTSVQHSNAGDSQIASEPKRKVRFFIASNSDQSKKDLAVDFPDAIFLGGEHRRDSTQGMQLALVEWLLLSRCEFLVHTYGSTFAEQAALRGSLVSSVGQGPVNTDSGYASTTHYQPPIVGIWEGRLLAHTNPRLPFCGIQQFARAYSDGRRYGRYRTGANTDNAEVVSMMWEAFQLVVGLPQWMECSTATSSDDLVISHFCKQIFHAFGHPNKETAILKKKWRVAATSSWYFRHFFVNNSLLDHDPRLVMLSCMFLAGKTEDSFVNIVDLLKIYNKATEARVLECEILLLEGLEFNLKVFHPQNCLYSIIADIKRREQVTASAAASAGTISDPAAGEVRRQRVSELLHQWQAMCEEYLVIVQCSVLVRQVNALTLALSVMKVAAPEGLEGAVGLHAYLVEKFSAEFLASDVDLYLDAVTELVTQEQSAELQVQREETLRTCILELRSRNRWKRSGGEVK